MPSGLKAKALARSKSSFQMGLPVPASRREIHVVVEGWPFPTTRRRPSGLKASAVTTSWPLPMGPGAERSLPASRSHTFTIQGLPLSAGGSDPANPLPSAEKATGPTSFGSQSRGVRSRAGAAGFPSSTGGKSQMRTPLVVVRANRRPPGSRCICLIGSSAAGKSRLPLPRTRRRCFCVKVSRTSTVQSS